jgi:hypothetical protein
VHSLGGGRMTLDYPAIDPMADLTSRPAHANGGSVKAGKLTVGQRRGTVFTLVPGAHVRAGGARDRYGNRNGKAVTLAR